MINKTVTSQPVFDMDITLILTEQQARALYSLTLYGPQEFLKWFYKNMGKHYMEPHAQGLKSLFEVLKTELPPHFKVADDVREFLMLSRHKK
jgi:hypothetical protein